MILFFASSLTVLNLQTQKIIRVDTILLQIKQDVSFRCNLISGHVYNGNIIVDGVVFIVQPSVLHIKGQADCRQSRTKVRIEIAHHQTLGVPLKRKWLIRIIYKL